MQKKSNLKSQKFVLCLFWLSRCDQDKHWAQHFCCVNCSSRFYRWYAKKNVSLEIAVPMIWREQKDHVTDGRRRRPLERYPLQVRHKQDWDRGFILLLPQAVVLPESDAGSDVIKPASGFVIQNFQISAPCGARCIGHVVRTWSAVCSETQHSQFGEGARSHLCMDKWNRSTPVCKRLSLTKAARDKPIPTDLAPVQGTKTRSLETFSQYSDFHL